MKNLAVSCESTCDNKSINNSFMNTLGLGLPEINQKLPFSTIEKKPRAQEGRREKKSPKSNLYMHGKYFPEKK